MPLYMFSGTFYPTSQMPAWLRDAIMVSPLWHGVELCRGIALGNATATATAVHVAILAGLAVLGYFAARRTYQRAFKALMFAELFHLDAEPLRAGVCRRPAAPPPGDGRRRLRPCPPRPAAAPTWY